MKRFGFDVETTGNGPNDKIVTAQFFNAETKDTFLVDCRTDEGRTSVMKILSRPEYGFVPFVGLFEAYYVKKEFGIDLKIVGDAYTLALMLQEPDQSLEALSQKYLKKGKKGSLKELTNGTYNFDVKLTQAHIDYALEDAVLGEELEAEMFKRNPWLEKVYRLELELIPVLAQMRVWGIKIDSERLNRELVILEIKSAGLKTELFDQAGGEFRIGARADVKRILFEQMKLTPTLRTDKGDISVSAEALSLMPDNKFVSLLLEARHCASVLSSRKDLEDNIKDGFIRPEFRPLNWSGSSRIYSTRPSANQLPRELRRAAVPRKGYKFMYVDWSGAELMYLAYQAEQKDLIECYESGGDAHRFSFSKITGKPIDQITDEEREINKVVIFSVVYGSEGHAASRALGISIQEAREWVQKFFTAFPRIKFFLDAQVEGCKKSGSVQTWLGRRRVIRKIFASQDQVVEEGKRQAMNTPIQNGVADLLKWAMVRIYKLHRNVLQMAFVVFDSFLFEVEEEVKIEDIRGILEPLFSFSKGEKRVKFNFKIKEGRSWGDLMDGKVDKLG